MGDPEEKEGGRCKWTDSRYFYLIGKKKPIDLPPIFYCLAHSFHQMLAFLLLKKKKKGILTSLYFSSSAVYSLLTALSTCFGLLGLLGLLHFSFRMRLSVRGWGVGFFIAGFGCHKGWFTKDQRGEILVVICDIFWGVSVCRLRLYLFFPF